MDCWDMTFEQLKSSYFEECDGVHNSKLWIVEIWRLNNWKARTLRNAMVYITLNCGLLRYDVWTIEKLVLWGMRWCTSLYIVDYWDMTFGQLKSSYFEECDGVHNSILWIIEIWRLDNWKARTLRNAMVYITLNCALLRYDVWKI